MDHEVMRLECLKLAHSEGLTGNDAIKRAQELFDFLRAGYDGSTESRGIQAGMSNDKVRVVGVGNDDNFKDYIKDKKPE